MTSCAAPAIVFSPGRAVAELPSETAVRVLGGRKPEGARYDAAAAMVGRHVAESQGITSCKWSRALALLFFCRDGSEPEQPVDIRQRDQPIDVNHIEQRENDRGDDRGPDELCGDARQGGRTRVGAGADFTGLVL